MGTNKDKNKNKNKGDAIVRIPRPMWQQVMAGDEEIFLADYVIPQVSIQELTMTVEAVIARAPEDLTEQEAKARQDLEVAWASSNGALAHNQAWQARLKLDMRTARNEIVSLLATGVGMVDVLARSKVPVLAEEGRALKIEVFDALLDPARLSVRALCLAVKALEHQLQTQPELRARLEARVPDEVLTPLFAAQVRLGRELGLEPYAEGEGPSVNEAPVKARLARRLERFVVVLLASADPEQPATVARAKQVLQPLADLRADLARRRRRSKGAPIEDDGEEVVVGDEEEEVVEPAGRADD